MKNEPEFFPIQSLTFDPELQIRVRINEETIASYAERMATEDEMKTFPPVEIYYDGVKYWLADGHHRRAAAEMAGHEKVWAIIKSGTRDDALWAAIIGNGRQGFGLTKEDRKRAVLLASKRLRNKSNRMIAEALGCNEKTVRNYRESTADLSAVENERREGKDGKSRPAKMPKKTSTSQTEQEIAVESEEIVPPDTSVSAPVDDPVSGDTYPEPPCPNKDVQYFPKTTLKNISQESPHILLANLFAHFRKGFVEELVIMAMEKINDKLGKTAVQKILRLLNKRYEK